MKENLNIALSERIKRDAKAAGLHLDTYDADFYVGVIQGFLQEHDAALTAGGVRRFKR